MCVCVHTRVCTMGVVGFLKPQTAGLDEALLRVQLFCSQSSKLKAKDPVSLMLMKIDPPQYLFPSWQDGGFDMCNQ